MSSNGIISFRNPFDEFYETGFPDVTFRHSLIAPLWIDLNPVLNGCIYYRATNESDVLNQASSLIAGSNPEFGGFQPTLAVIVTWDRVPVHANTSIIVRSTINVTSRWHHRL